MIYARVHDQTVAEDYYAAMNQIEKRLDLLETINVSEKPIQQSERDRLLTLTFELCRPENDEEDRKAIIIQMQQILSGAKAFPLLISIESEFP